MQKDSDKALVTKARAGDRSAFDTLAHRCQDRLAAMVRSRIGAKLRARVEADDIVQEAFLRAYKAISNFNWQGDDSFFRWLTRISEHLIWNAAQKQPRLELMLDDQFKGPATRPDQSLRRQERFDRLEAALSALNPEQREAVRLSRIEGQSIARIAESMDRSPAAVKMLLSRALKRLKSSFGDTESLHLPDRALETEESGHDEGLRRSS